MCVCERERERARARAREREREREKASAERERERERERDRVPLHAGQVYSSEFGPCANERQALVRQSFRPLKRRPFHPPKP